MEIWAIAFASIKPSSGSLKTIIFKSVEINDFHGQEKTDRGHFEELKETKSEGTLEKPTVDGKRTPVFPWSPRIESVRRCGLQRVSINIANFAPNRLVKDMKTYRVAKYGYQNTVLLWKNTA